ncbi:MAG: VOC family protein [Deinococcota bacterium]
MNSVAKNLVTKTPVTEMRVAVTTTDYERLVNFYCEGLGIQQEELWTQEDTKATILSLGKATLEIFDEHHAEVVDSIETGQRTSGSIRFALEVPDLEAALERLVATGATVVHPPVTTPWNHRNVRLQDPDGMQVTLFQVL